MTTALEAVAAIDTRWLLGLYLLALNLWCSILVWRAPTVRRDRLLWIAVIFLCPVVGCVLWFVLGPKPLLTREAASGERPSEGPGRPAG